MSFRGFATLNIYADDVPAAAEWYAEVLGVAPYFERPGPEGRPAYVEFRVGDHQAELGIIDRRFAPPGAPAQPGGAIMHWHVDDLDATVARLLSLGATELQPITPRGEGFVTASVVDPFGNVLGVMTNPHYLQMLAADRSG
jgi:predicted enzyme related to lactoylglutathione lyase